jgi:hypothetical protein
VTVHGRAVTGPSADRMIELLEEGRRPGDSRSSEPKPKPVVTDRRVLERPASHERIAVALDPIVEERSPLSLGGGWL